MKENEERKTQGGRPGIKENEVEEMDEKMDAVREKKERRHT